MNAFDEIKKDKNMPQNNWAIQDNSTFLWLLTYAIDLHSCQWTNNPQSALHLATHQDCDDLITSWGEVPGDKFIGKNPPPR